MLLVKGSCARFLQDFGHLLIVISTVDARITFSSWLLIVAASVSQQLVQSDRQFADAPAGRVENGIGDRRRYAHESDFA